MKALDTMISKDRPKYEKFWKEFGVSIKNGVYSDRQNQDKLQDLLLFASSHSDELTSLSEYVARMPESQAVIYYATGKGPFVCRTPAANGTPFVRKVSK